jgi:phosphate transport system substrate-binding protein
MQRATVLASLGLALALLGGAGCQPAEKEQAHLVLTGSRDMAPLVREIAQRFEAAHPGVLVHVQPSSSEKGLADVRVGLADLGMVARPLRADEGALHAVLLGTDAIVLVVNKSNPVSSLTENQVRELFLRQLTDWRSVGGSERPVILVGRPPGHAIRGVFRQHFHIETSSVRPDQTAATGPQALQAVSNLPGALAYASLAEVEKAVSSGLSVRPLCLAGVAATQANVASGAYPLTRPCYLVARSPASTVSEVLELVHSPEVQALARAHGLVPGP